jgi:hypothetical protein
VRVERVEPAIGLGKQRAALLGNDLTAQIVDDAIAFTPDAVYST